VKGFALTLAIGVGLSMITAIFVTRTFLHFIVGSPVAHRLNLFASDIPERQARATRRGDALPAIEGEPR
jgi:preprotein translocase subunit SecD